MQKPLESRASEQWHKKSPGGEPGPETSGAIYREGRRE